jgi:hypothetical protein
MESKIVSVHHMQMTIYPEKAIHCFVRIVAISSMLFCIGKRTEHLTRKNLQGRED